MPLVNIKDKFIVRTGSGGVAAPSQPSISSVTPTTFVVSWEAVASATAYRLDVATDSGFTSFVSGFNNKAVAGTSDTVTGLSAETTYYVRVRAVTAGASSSSASQQTEVQTSTLTNGLLAFYKLSDLTDSSGNGNTLTNNGDVTFSSGKIGNAAVFDGSNHLTYPQLFMSGASAFSFACYVKCTSSTTYIYGEDSVTDSVFLVISTHGDKATFNFMDGWNPIQSSSTITDNQWHHLACVYNGASSVAKLYFDGTEESSRDSVDATLPISNAPNFGLGGPPSGWGAKLQGSIDAVGLWSRALTDAEITELYNAGAGLEIN